MITFPSECQPARFARKKFRSSELELFSIILMHQLHTNIDIRTFQKLH